MIRSVYIDSATMITIAYMNEGSKISTIGYKTNTLSRGCLRLGVKVQKQKLIRDIIDQYGRR